MPDISKETVYCPNCLTPQDRFFLSSEPVVQTCHSDFYQKIGGSQSVLLHGVIQCSRCAYTDFQAAFPLSDHEEPRIKDDPFALEELPGAEDEGEGKKESAKIPSGFIARNIMPFLDRDNSHSFVPHLYEYGALVSRARNDSCFKTAVYYLHAAWACRVLGKPELEPWYDRKYSEWFGKEVEGHKGKGVKPAVAAYLAGEGARRAGDRNAAVRWFCRVPSLIPVRADLSWFSDFTQNQSAYPSDFVEDTLKPSLVAIFSEATSIG